MPTSSDTNVKICKGLLVVKTESGPILEKVLVETKQDPTSKNVKCRLYRIPPDFFDQSHLKNLHEDLTSCCTRCVNNNHYNIDKDTSGSGESSRDIKGNNNVATTSKLPKPIAEKKIRPVEYENIIPKDNNNVALLSSPPKAANQEPSEDDEVKEEIIDPGTISTLDKQPNKKRQVKNVTTSPKTRKSKRPEPRPSAVYETNNDARQLGVDESRSNADLSTSGGDAGSLTPTQEHSGTSNDTDFFDEEEFESSSSDFEVDDDDDATVDLGPVNFIDSKLRRLRSQQSKLYLTTVRYKTRRSVPADIGDDPEPILRRLSSGDLLKGVASKVMAGKRRRKRQPSLVVTTTSDDAAVPVQDSLPLVSHDSAIIEERTLGKLRQLETKDYVIDFKPSGGIMKKSDGANKSSSGDARSKPSSVTIKRASLGQREQSIYSEISDSPTELISDPQKPQDDILSTPSQFDVSNPNITDDDDDDNYDDDFDESGKTEQYDGDDRAPEPISDLYKSDIEDTPNEPDESPNATIMSPYKDDHDNDDVGADSEVKGQTDAEIRDLDHDQGSVSAPCSCKPCKKKKPKKSKRKTKQAPLSSTDDDRQPQNVQVSQTSIKTYTGSYIGVLEDDVCFCYPIEAFSQSVLDFLGEESLNKIKKCHHDSNLPLEVIDRVKLLKSQAAPRPVEEKQSEIQSGELHDDDDDDDVGDINNDAIKSISEVLLEKPTKSVEEVVKKERKVVRTYPINNNNLKNEEINVTEASIGHQNSDGEINKNDQSMSMMALKSQVLSSPINPIVSDGDVGEEYLEETRGKDSQTLSTAQTSTGRSQLPPRKPENYVQDICLHTYQFDESGMRICICPQYCPHHKKRKTKNQKHKNPEPAP